MFFFEETFYPTLDLLLPSLLFIIIVNSYTYFFYF